ncbi:hypothetical protein [Spirosoma lituiforme]
MATSSSFNSEQYAWADVTIQIGSRVLTGVQGISYKRTQEKGFVYGKGDKPMSIQRGNYAFEGSVKLLQDEVETLIQGAPNKDLLRLRNLTISIGYEREDGTSVIDNIVGAEFSEVEKALEQGKQFMEIELPIMFLDVKYDV